MSSLTFTSLSNFPSGFPFQLAELKKICSELDLPTSGSKLELVERIVCHDDKPIVTLQPDDEAELLDNVSDTAETDIGVSLEVPMESPVHEPAPPTTAKQQTTRGLKRRAEEAVEEDDGVTVAVKKPTLVAPPPVEPPAPAKSNSTAATSVSHVTSEEEASLPLCRSLPPDSSDCTLD
ncbi:hypothetical protein SprV_0902781400 [Sparganum proliferum]